MHNSYLGLDSSCLIPTTPLSIQALASAAFFFFFVTITNNTDNDRCTPNDQAPDLGRSQTSPAVRISHLFSTEMAEDGIQ